MSTLNPQSGDNTNTLLQKILSRLGNLSENGEYPATENVAGMKGLPTPRDGSLVATLGYHTPYDGGNGVYVYDETSAAADNGGTVITPTSGTGRFLLLSTDTINVRQFGARGDGVSDDLSAITAAIAANPSGATLRFPAGTYMVSDTIVVSKPMVLRGEGSAFQFTTHIAPMVGFPGTSPLFRFTSVLGRSAMYDIGSMMNRRGGNWVQFEGNVASVNIERCTCRHVNAGYWGVFFNNTAPVNGAALVNIIGNLFYDFDGGGIATTTNGGGDSVNILRNTFQLVNSSSHVLYWSGVAGAACFNFSENNASGAAKFIAVEGAYGAKITKNQLEMTTPYAGGGVSAMVSVLSAGVGVTIADNNLNCHSNATAAIYLNDAQHCLIANNTISNAVNSVKTTSASSAITFVAGSNGAAVLDDPLFKVSTVNPPGTSTFADLNLRGSNPNNPSLTAGRSDTTTVLNIDFPNVAGFAANVRMYRSTNTTANTSSGFQIFKGDGSSALQHFLTAFGNSYLNALTGNLGLGGVTSPAARLHLPAGTAAAGSAPLRFTSGTLLTVPVAGTVEFNTDAFYATVTTGSARKTFAFLESPTFSGKVTTPASTAAAAGLRILPGVAPTAPADGDMWMDGVALKIRVAGVTRTVTLV